VVASLVVAVDVGLVWLGLTLNCSVVGGDGRLRDSVKLLVD